MITVYARKDLKMRKGKMAAQSAHAAMKLVLGMMKVIDGHYVMLPEQYSRYQEWVEGGMKIDVVLVSDFDEIQALQAEADAKGLLNGLIIDHGRTEFKGVRTPTCLGVAPEGWPIQDAEPNIFVSNHNALQERFVNKEIPETKQVIVVDRMTKPGKEEFSSKVAEASVSALMMSAESYQYGLRIKLEEDSPLLAWLAGAFAKVVVGTDDIYGGISQMTVHGLPYATDTGPFCFASDAEFPDSINRVTGGYKLM